jgi:hypothetical protein
MRRINISARPLAESSTACFETALFVVVFLVSLHQWELPDRLLLWARLQMRVMHHENAQRLKQRKDPHEPRSWQPHAALTRKLPWSGTRTDLMMADDVFCLHISLPTVDPEPEHYTCI